MKHRDSHLPDRRLVLDIDGELRGSREKAHLAACWKCRARRRELEDAIGDYVRMEREELPSAEGPRALLGARMGQLASPEFAAPEPAWRYAWAAGVFGLVVVGLFLAGSIIMRQRSSAAIVSIPDSMLTPGATLLVSRPAVCATANMKNKAVPASLQRKVFEEYGIAGADPRSYEVDYLVTPALGGADDIHNLWPHSYSATVWNAQVKDALEDRLREMVCDGSLDLTQAQREIATNWISAYKKYFHTDEPLAEHRK